jgi:hypothetical protein
MLLWITGSVDPNQWKSGLDLTTWPSIGFRCLVHTLITSNELAKVAPHWFT